LESDHPGFNDPVYRARRGELATIAKQYSLGEPIPHIVYTEQEIATWGAVYDRLGELQGKYACKAYLEALEKMQRFCGYTRHTSSSHDHIMNFLLLP
jgi:phenylalanine-4-hydroxylase